MLEVFANPGFLAAGGALVSAPIIIHLINRMRFKRLRWAAMEFLLKAQKRTRKRLIIEQIILLLLRCLLVALVAFLVSRFLGFSLADFQSKDGLHIIVLDDSLSMNDALKGNPTAFEKARTTVEGIVKEIGKSTTKDRVVILPISQVFLMDRNIPVDPALVWKDKDEIKYKIYQNLGESARVDELKKDLAALKVSNLHVNLLQALDKARQLAAANAVNRVTLNVISDFRDVDWAKPQGEALGKKLAEIRKLGVDPKLKDVAAPQQRSADAKGPFKANPNLAITEFRAGARVVGQDTPVEFEATIVNFDTEERAVTLAAFDENTGKEMFEVDFKDVMPIRISGGATARVSFNKRFNANLKPGESYFANISVRLVGPDSKPLDKDGLPDDNIRYATVEVRQTVPILIVDGERAKGRQENNDSFFIRTVLISLPGASYDVEYGDLITGEASAKVLERGDLSRYPAIFILNVSELTPKQVTNLEKYVADGGGVAFFLGPKVDADFYSSRKKEEGKIVYKDDFGLYKAGKGIFPVPISDPPFPPDRFLEPEVTSMEQILLRDDLFQDINSYPIFGKIFNDKSQRVFLSDMNIKRYFKVPRADWIKDDPNKVQELATLPNESESKAYVKVVLAMVGDMKDGDKESKLMQILANPEYAAYQKGLSLHQKHLYNLISPTSDKKAYHLAAALKGMLEDEGRKGVYPSLKEFWGKADPQILALHNEIERLHDQVKYGDPFMVLRRYGSGQVVAVMTTAGKDWNNMGGGTLGAVLYPAIVWEMLNQLSSKASEAKRLVGSSLTLSVDKEQFVKQGQLKMVRTYFKPTKDGAVQVKDEKFGTPAGKDSLNFTFDRNLEPGLYVTKLYETSNEKTALATWGHVFNIDAENEGRLERVDSLDKILPDEAKDIVIVGSDKVDPGLANRHSDFSESPWLFLIFLFVLVAEQALAVHLSFHLKGGDADLHAPKSGHVTPQARAA